MSMTISNLMSGCDNTVFYTPEFRAVLEDHMEYLRTHSSTVKKTIDAGIAYRYEYDFYGMLIHYSVPYHVHWVIMRMMEMDNPNELRRDMEYFLVPDGSVLEGLRSGYSAITDDNT